MVKAPQVESLSFRDKKANEIVANLSQFARYTFFTYSKTILQNTTAGGTDLIYQKNIVADKLLFSGANLEITICGFVNVVAPGNHTINVRVQDPTGAILAGAINFTAITANTFFEYNVKLFRIEGGLALWGSLTTNGTNEAEVNGSTFALLPGDISTIQILIRAQGADVGQTKVYFIKGEICPGNETESV